MKVTNDSSMTATVELETHAGQQTFISSLRNDGDRRYWNKDVETCELAGFVRDNSKFSQIIVKCGDNYSRIK